MNAISEEEEPVNQRRRRKTQTDNELMPIKDNYLRQLNWLFLFRNRKHLGCKFESISINFFYHNGHLWTRNGRELLLDYTWVIAFHRVKKKRHSRCLIIIKHSSYNCIIFIGYIYTYTNMNRTKDHCTSA